jgi:nucleotidyltransferase substrate binding protein (TIGR01987 family)
MTIDYTTLENAIARLKEGLKAYEKFKEDEELKEIVRDSLVQRFEFTYEHSAKILAKTLKDQGFAEVSSNLKKTLFREAGKAGYIQDVEKWFLFLESRNKTSHEYDENFVNDEEFIEFIKDFYEEAKNLLENLKEIKE